MCVRLQLQAATRLQEVQAAAAQRLSDAQANAAARLQEAQAQRQAAVEELQVSRAAAEQYSAELLTLRAQLEEMKVRCPHNMQLTRH